MIQTRSDRQQRGPARTSAAAPATFTAKPADSREQLEGDLSSLKSLVKQLTTAAKPGKKADDPLQREIAAAQAAISLARLEAALAGGTKLTPGQAAQMKAMRAKLEKTLALAKEMSTKTD